MNKRSPELNKALSAEAQRAARIAALNDAFRSSLTGGSVLITAGVIALGRDTQARILRAVATFKAFSDDNDPYGERDFGSFDIVGEKIFFKIDYYDKTRTAGSDDPSDPSVTHRVLTIMLSSEY